MAELGGMLAAAILKVVGDQIGAAIGGQIKLVRKFDADLKKMKMALESVEAVLEDAEKRSITDKPTLLWLKRLKDLMYAISNMIDEFEVDTQPSARKLSFKNYLTIMIPCLTIGPKIRMANKMETMMADLEKITEQHKKFKSEKDTNANEPKVTDIRETTSDTETLVVGRTTEKEEVLASLSQSMQNDITILPICGLGGLGKTTLAKMVYNSSQFEEYSRVWVYVSRTLDLMTIGNSIISQLSKEKKESGYTIMQMIHNSLHELLTDKKILIVLDDLWESDVVKLKSLTNMLKIGKGSNVVVIVTTRSEDIAKQICTIQPYKVTPLTDDMCWSIIKQKSEFESRGDKDQLVEIGKVIAMKCCGVALAATCLGYTLQSMEPSGWVSVKDSNIWTVSSSIDTPYSQVLASLKLSYSVIPSNLKLCFAYCAIFPKGHKIVKDDLIDQWISLGFCTRQLGEKYISQLLGLSFLEHSKSSSLSFKNYLTIMIPCLTIGPKIRMANKMETMMADLEKITEQHKKFKSEKDTNANEPKVTDIRETTSDTETLVVGRTTEKEEVLASLSQSMQNDITILPICGLGGLGKTTLAKMVYNSSQFEEYSRVWVYVSRTLDLMTIGNSIISQLSKEKKESGYTIMQMIHNSLHELLTDKKILIVLDDLWESDVVKLKSLTNMLKIGKGSNVVVIVTTRSEDIAKQICTIQPYKVTPLTDDMCWSIIKQKSEFESRGDKDQLVEIGKVIAMKCCGVALAATCLGYTLQSMEPSGWVSVKDSNIWTVSSSIDTPYSQVLASLKLSYSVIPSNLKLCFAYCAIFPKGHKIVKDDLIDQWISLGFCTRQLGEKYISQLLGLSFLEHSKSSSTIEIHVEDITFLTMHDLVHDLARSVMGEEILVAGEEGDHKGSYYHYALLNDCSKSLSSELSKIWALRFLECGQTELRDAAFLSAKSLRVLDLSECSVHKLSDSIGVLKQLRYLNAPRIQNTTIPDSITSLSKLIYLNLHGSPAVLALPESIGDIEGLVYLNLSGCSGIKKLPPSFGRLKELVHLDVSNCSCVEGISEFLGRFNQLKYLNLSSCHIDGHMHEALVGLIHLQYLNLKDTNISLLPDDLTKLRYLNISNRRGLRTDRIVSLINHICSNFFDLEHLDLSNNDGIHNVPESICRLRKLHTLDLSGCFNLAEIPESVGRIDSLKFLYLNDCIRIREPPQLGGSALSLPHFVVQPGYCDSGSNLVKLQSIDPVELQITKLENVKSVGEAQRIKLMEKQNLEILALKWTRDVERSVGDIMLLEKLVPPSTLKKLEICGYNGVSFPSWVVGQLPNLEKLFLTDMANLKEWDTSYSSGEESVIEELEIHDCPKLRMKPFPPRAKSWEISNSDNVLSAWEECTASHTNASSSSSPITIKLSVKDCNVPINQWRLLQHLSGPIKLRIGRCGDLTGSSETSQYLSSVETLHLEYEDMEELPEWLGELTSLQNLEISKCRRLKGLQDNMRQLIKLQSLKLKSCNSMASLPHWFGELTSLKKLLIRNCDVLRCLPESIQQLTSLQTLNIAACPELKHFFESEEGKLDLNHNQEKVCVLSISLSGLCIQQCEGIKSLPDGIQQLTNLQDLLIIGCPELKQWCELEENQMKLAHLKRKVIRE